MHLDQDTNTLTTELVLEVTGNVCG